MVRPLAIRDDSSSFDFDAERLKPQILDIANDADGGNHALSFERPHNTLGVFQHGGNAIWLFLNLCHFGGGQDFDALFFKAFAGKCGDLGILRWKNLRQYFDDSHLRAHGSIERREFDPDRARTHDDELFGKAIRHHGLEIRPDEFAIWLDARDHARPRAGRDDDIFGVISARAQNAFGDWMGRLHRWLFRCGDRNLAGLRIVASPQITSTLFFFSKKPTPPFNCAGHRASVSRPWRDRRRSAFDRQAIVLGVTERRERSPPSAAGPWSECSPSSGRCRRAARARRRRSSCRAARRGSRRHSRPGPAPMTMRSKRSIAMGASSRQHQHGGGSSIRALKPQEVRAPMAPSTTR